MQSEALMERYLEEELAVPDLKKGRKPLVKAANENGLFRDGEVEQWLKYVEARNQSSHEYAQANIESIHLLIPDFIDDAIGLYQSMTGQLWD